LGALGRFCFSCCSSCSPCSQCPCSCQAHSFIDGNHCLPRRMIPRSDGSRTIVAELATMPATTVQELAAKARAGAGADARYRSRAASARPARRNVAVSLRRFETRRRTLKMWPTSKSPPTCSSSPSTSSAARPPISMRQPSLIGTNSRLLTFSRRSSPAFSEEINRFGARSARNQSRGRAAAQSRK
jgi:hypothetical protein